MPQNYENISVTTHSLWKFYRLMRVREYVLGLNTSGLYHWRYAPLKAISEATGISTDALKRDLGFFHRLGLVYYRNGYLKIVRLEGKSERLMKLYHAWKNEINQSDNPKQFFVNIYLRDELAKNVNYQLVEESKKCADPRNREKLRSLVNLDSEQIIGRKQGVNVSHRSLGGIFQRSVSTGTRYFDRLKKSGLITIIPQSEVVAPYTPEKYSELKKAIIFRGGREYLYGCYLFIRNGFIYERKTNNIVFNW